MPDAAGGLGGAPTAVLTQNRCSSKPGYRQQPIAVPLPTCKSALPRLGLGLKHQLPGQHIKGLVLVGVSLVVAAQWRGWEEGQGEGWMLCGEGLSSKERQPGCTQAGCPRLQHPRAVTGQQPCCTWFPAAVTPACRQGSTASTCSPLLSLLAHQAQQCAVAQQRPAQHRRTTMRTLRCPCEVGVSRK